MPLLRELQAVDRHGTCMVSARSIFCRWQAILLRARDGDARCWRHLFGKCRFIFSISHIYVGHDLSVIQSVDKILVWIHDCNYICMIIQRPVRARTNSAATRLRGERVWNIQWWYFVSDKLTWIYLDYRQVCSWPWISQPRVHTKSIVDNRDAFRV